MQRIKLIGLSSLMVVALSVASLMAMCGKCGVEGKAGKGKKGHKHPECCEMKGSCPAKVDGAKVQVENKQDGVTITITSADAQKVKEIQESAAKMAEMCATMKEDAKTPGKGAFSCPMKCEGDKSYGKPGKCPKCNMELKGPAE